MSIEHQAVTAAFATWLALLAAFALHLDIPWWSGISAWIVISADSRAVLRKGFQQAVGTVIAAVFGYLVALQIQSFMTLQILFIIFFASLGIYKRHMSNAPQAWLLGTLLFLTLIVESIIDPAALFTTAVYRSYEILTGTTVAAIVALTLGQRRPRAAPTRAEVATTEPTPTPYDHRTLVLASLFGGAVTVVILVIWDGFDIPNVIPVLISVVVVCTPDIGSMRATAVDRAAGCVLGGGAGILTVATGLESLLTWSMVFLMGLYLAGTVHNSGKPHAIVGTLAGGVFIFAMVGGDGPQSSLLPAIDVVFGITFGSILMWLFLLLVTPWVQSRELTTRAREPRTEC